MSLHALALPDHVVQDLEYEAQADAQIGRALGVAAMIRDYNPVCELVWISERATEPGLIPARWAVKVHHRDLGAESHYLMWVGENGEYREPSAGMIQWLQAQDLRKVNVRDELRKAREKRARDVEKAREEASGASIENFAIFAKSKINPGVSFSDARPWTNRVERLPGE